jgi:hypothetical protein
MGQLAGSVVDYGSSTSCKIPIGPGDEAVCANLSSRPVPDKLALVATCPPISAASCEGSGR